MTDAVETYKPMFVSFVDLYGMFAPLHMGVKKHVDTLSDVWKMGAPSPTSIIRNPKGYDERKVQPGNVEKRLLMYIPMAKWITEVSAERGMPYTMRQALNMLEGKADYGLDEGIE
jgi:hypothetical protein